MNPHLAIDWVQGVTVAGVDGWLGLIAMALWMLVIEPLYGRKSFQAMLRALDAGVVNARRDMYRHWILSSWLSMAAILLLVFFVLGWTPQQLGLRLPTFNLHLGSGFVVGMVAAAVGGMLLGMFAASRQKRRGAVAVTPAMNDAVARLLPHTPTERRHYALLSVTAGVCEEIVWRGVLLAALVAIFPQAPTWVLLLPMPLMFGWAHWYQGWSGVLVTGILGAVFTGLYAVTGSLLIPIILHALVDLRGLLIPLPPEVSGSDLTP
ncbi:MAG TPA: CPBP family intramembrane glutamic endopeptidase [Rhodanobacteraceae bacterium]|nr:CPBP family intramembrane glutamic endopeptidase [Rhodanobacteraceae bacterium]